MSQILGLLFAIALSLPFVTRFLPYSQQGNQTVQTAAAAKLQKIYSEAVQEYVKANYTSISGSATASSSVTITTAMLRAAGLLDTSITGQNSYGQVLQAQVLQPIAGNLVIWTWGLGGVVLGDKLASEMAAVLTATGDHAGVIPKNVSQLFTTGTSYAYGAYGEFAAPTAGLTGLAAGRVASVTFLNNGQVVGNYLYRNAVAGQPQLNMMNTDLGLNGNNITAAKNITATAQVQAGTVNLTTIATENAVCTSAGSLARDSFGKPLSCDSSSGSLKWSRLSGSKVKMLYAGLPIGSNVNFANYLPAADQASASGINVVVRLFTMHSGNNGTSCFIYLDGVMVAQVGFDTAADNEWLNGTTSFTVSPANHVIDYSCDIGYVAGASALLLSYW